MIYTKYRKRIVGIFKWSIDFYVPVFFDSVFAVSVKGSNFQKKLNLILRIRSESGHSTQPQLSSFWKVILLIFIIKEGKRHTISWACYHLLCCIPQSFYSPLSEVDPILQELLIISPSHTPNEPITHYKDWMIHPECQILKNSSSNG